MDIMDKPNNAEAFVPFSPNQAGVYFDCIKNPSSTAYNFTTRIDFPAGTDTQGVFNALIAVADAHPVLKAAVDVRDGVAGLVRRDNWQPKILITELPHGEAMTTEREQAFIRPFAIQSELFRSEIFAAENGCHLLTDIHHLVFDGGSLNLFLDDLANAMDGNLLRYEDTALLPRDGEDNVDAELYRDLLEPFDSANAIYGMTQTENTGRMRSSEFYVDKDAIAKLAASCEVTKNTIFMTALSGTVSRLSLQEDVLYSLDFNMRKTLGADDAYGMYVGTLPLAVRLNKELTVCEAAHLTMNVMRTVISHPHWSLGEMSHEYGFTPQLNYTFRNGMNRGKKLEAKVYIAENVKAQFPLSVTVDVLDDCYLVTVERDENAVGEDIAKLFTASLEKFVNNMLACGKDTLLADVLITDEEDIRFLDGLNDNAAPYPKNMTVVDLIAKTAKRLHGEVCLVYKDVHMTYGEFAEVTDKMAATISSVYGVGRDDRVCLLLDRTEKMITSPVSVMKSGGAYVPIDPGYPDERIEFIINDSDPKLIIADEAYRERLTKICEISVVSPEELQNAQSDGVPTPPSAPDLAYVIYTSGTTGKPKGVMVEHEGLVNLVTQLKGFCGLDEGDGILLLANYVFDASIEDIFTALTGGFRLIVSPKDLWMEPDPFYAMCEQERAAYADTTPSLLESLDFARMPYMKTINSGGEALTDSLHQKLCAAGVKLINSYGPTEVTISSMINLNADKNTIGKPLANLTAYVLDTYKKRLPQGAVGELFLGGIGLARGYLNRPDLTGEKFMQNPFGEGRIYATGDLVMLDADGDAVYMGRNDFQVKIRGFRVEIGEIEKRLSEIDGVERTVVAAFDDIGSNTKFLAAYFTSKKDAHGAELVTANALRVTLTQELPYYMVPSSFIRVDGFPVTASGKVDMHALPKPVPSAADEKAPPETETEKFVYEAAAQLLRTDAFGVTTDLFTVGLHSLLAVGLAVKIEEKLPESVSAADIMRGRSVRGIASRLDSGINVPKKRQHMPAQDFYPLRKNQLGVYMGWQNNPDALLYNIPIALHFGKDVDTKRLAIAVEAAIDRNPILKANAEYRNGVIGLVRHDGRKIRPEVTVRSVMREEFVRPFDLEDDELIRVFIVQDGGEGSWLYLDVHHIVFDGMSLGVFMKHISEAYNGALVDKAESTYDAFDDMLYMSDEESAAINARAQEYFDGLLTGFTGPPLPGENLADELGATKKIEKRILKAAVKKLSISQNAFFQRSLCEAICKLSRLDKAVIIMTSSGRHDGTTAGLVGMFVQTIPFVYEKGMDESAVQKRLFDCIAHDSYTLLDMSGKYGWTPRIAYVNTVGIDEAAYSGQLDFTEEPLFEESIEAKFPLTVTVDDAGDDYLLRIEYSENSFSGEGAEKIMRAIFNELGFSEPDTADLSIRKGESLGAAYESIVDSFRKATLRYPGKNAVVCGDQSEHSITYKVLDEKSDALAARLSFLGVGAGDAVGIMLDRDEPFPLAALGVLKTGACYMPLDPAYPDERLAYMAEKAESKCIIASDSQLGRLPTFCGVKLGMDEALNLPLTVFPKVEIQPDDTFVLLFTSGTTGMPKGVMLTHRNLFHSIAALKNICGITSTDVVAGYGSFGFDAAMLDAYPALTSGATEYIVPEALRLDLEGLADYFEKNAVTFGLITTQLGRQFAIKYPKIGSLRALAVGGEALVALKLPEYQLINLYGPTECTIAATGLVLDKEYDKIPIGLPLTDYRVYIVDENMDAVLPGEEGELCIGGPAVGKGYINDPERTAKSFVPDPFSPEFPVMYRTGDVARIATGGESNGFIVFEGRRDHQVKIRGFRVELTEVEARIREYPGVADATVQALPAPSGGLRIVGYIVVECDARVDVSALNAFIEEKLPPYTVPSAILKLDRIPLNRNGKVDRNALPDAGAAVSSEDFEAPRGEFERILLDVSKQVLGTDSIGATSDLVALGMSSLSAITIAMEAGKRAGVKIKALQLVKQKSVRAVAETYGYAKMEEAVLPEAESKTSQAAAQTAAPSAFHKLTPEQLGIYFDTLKMPEGIAYNIPTLLEFDEGVDADRLCAAIYEVLSAHPFLGTYVVSEKGVPSFAEPPILPVQPQIERMTREELEETKATFVRPFGLFTPPLYCIRIVVCEGRTYFFSDFHHIIVDGSSLALLLAQIQQVYSGGSIEREKYSGFNLCDMAAQPKDTTASREYYRNILAEAAATQLRADIQGNSGDSARSGMISFSLSAEQTVALKHSFPGGLSSAFLGAFTLCIRKFEGEDNIRIVVDYSGRDRQENADAISMLVKSMLFGVSISGGDSLSEIAEKCADAMFETIENSSFPLVSINSEFGFTPGLAFNYVGDMIGAVTLGSVTGKELPLFEKPQPKLPLNVTVSHTEGGASGIVIEYDQSKYSETAAKRFAESYEALLSSFATKPDTLARDVAALSSGQIDEIKSFIREDEHLDDALSIPEVFAQHAQRSPDKTAVIGSDRSYTYRELAETTDKIANALIVKGVNPGTPVAFILHRTSRIPAAQLGIIKSGGCFLPIDPEYPVDRVRHMLRDSAAKYVIVDKGDAEADVILDKIGSSIAALDLDTLVAQGKPGAPDVTTDGNSPAYIIYTSGTTGLPKGVALRHKGLLNYVSPLNRQFRDYVEADGVELAITTVTFDPSIKDVFGMLLNGVTCVVATEDECRNPASFAVALERYGCNALDATPSVLSALLASPKVRTAAGNIKLFVIGGEKFPPSLYDLLKITSPAAKILNAYGPTETTIECNTKYLSEDDTEITVGPPVNATPEFIMDKDGQPLPVGCVGELWIGGDQVAIGYVNRPELTAEKFVILSDELSGRLGLAPNNRRFYKSGDLARMNPQGEPVILGRNDSQVKLRGQRIELGEIEKAVESYPGVTRAYVQIRTVSEVEQLCAYFTADCAVHIPELKRHLAKGLPAYMVPVAYKHMKEMPYTPSGKIDVKSLPEPVLADAANYAAPETPAQKRFCDIYRNVLSLRREVGLDDDFFTIGGTSLLATQVTIEADDAGYKITYADVFANPTPRALAAVVEAEQVSNAETKAEAESEADEIKDYDYSKIDTFLGKNTEASLLSLTRRPLGNICLTGATGYLGAHILYAFIKDFYGVAFVPVRAETRERAERRLKTILVYYFEDDFAALFGSRIVVIPGSITQDALYKEMEHLPIDTYINAAANVKHFSSGTDIEDVNIGGMKLGLDFAKKLGAAFVQISTTSTSGLSIDGKPNPHTVFSENMLYFGQDLTNKYVRSKFIAERYALEAAANGMTAKVIRVGNLMARNLDGIFQANFNTNSFLKDFKAYRYIGKIPFSAMNQPIEFAPIGAVAHGVLALASTPRENSVFHLFNNHNVTTGDFIRTMNTAGYIVEPCEQAEFDAAFSEALHDRAKSEVVAGLMAYSGGAKDSETAGFLVSCELTLGALARKGFYWSITDNEYFTKLINHLGSLGFFDLPGEV
jgi:amino acid adenylation domain-containing protein